MAQERDANTAGAGTGTGTGTPSPVPAAIDPSTGYPEGVVLGKDGKPCRTCTDTRSWLALAKSKSKPKSASSPSTTTTTTTPTTTTTSPSQTRSANGGDTSPPLECPADVATLGRATWTLLHTISATYPSSPTPAQKHDMFTFMTSFARVYPCWVCADGLQEWMRRPENRLDFGVEGVEGESGSSTKSSYTTIKTKTPDTYDYMGALGGGGGTGGKSTSTSGAMMSKRGAGPGWLDSRDRFGLWMCMAHNAVNVKTGKKEFDCSRWEERWRTGCGGGGDVD
ncbi:hypothetical protein DFH27DRAFT_654633 [Peziza echinospora]|nr:hypothetical protein DFH27DRAFT_654633 [Peziza echinospora]